MESFIGLRSLPVIELSRDGYRFSMIFTEDFFFETAYDPEGKLFFFDRDRWSAVFGTNSLENLLDDEEFLMLYAEGVFETLVIRHMKEKRHVSDKAILKLSSG